MYSVALIGADGSGKSTLVRELPGRISAPVCALYMGMNPEACTHTLPTTKLVFAVRRALGGKAQGGPPDPRRRTPVRGWRRPLKALKRTFRAGLLFSEEWYRLTVAAWHRRRGTIVLFDRDFFADYYAHDVQQGSDPGRRRSWGSRLHGWLLTRCFRRPDHYVLLDAPAELLHARKPEGSIEALESRRQEYLNFAEQHPEVVKVDVARELERIVDEVTALLESWSHPAGTGQDGPRRAE